MRFSAAINTSQPMRNTAPAELIRRILSARPPRLTRENPPVPAHLMSLPLDLDQRVRATGEW
ncbi:MAG: hypothetical protein ABI907_07865 [Ramlibacter sp.]